jgi:hypothetical protein
MFRKKLWWSQKKDVYFRLKGSVIVLHVGKKVMSALLCFSVFLVIIYVLLIYYFKEIVVCQIRNGKGSRASAGEELGRPRLRAT